jgi:outer membrane protein TolC
MASKMKISIIILFTFLILPRTTIAQTITENFSIPMLPPLEKVIDFVANNSHLVKEQEAMTQLFNQSIEITKKKWMDKVFVDLGAQRSNNGAVLNVSNNISSPDLNSLSFQNLNSLRFGVAVRLSLYDGLARKNLVKEAQFRQLASEQHALFLRQDAKLRVVELYKNAELAYKLLSIKAEKKYALFIQKEMVENEFQQSQIHISELSRITELASNAFAEFEQASITYEKFYYQLEITLGTSLKDLK